MKRRKPAWRKAAYEYIKENGPATSAKLLTVLKTKRGRLWTESNKGPAHANGASQLLKADPRFEGRMVKQQTKGPDGNVYMSYEVLEWWIVDEE